MVMQGHITFDLPGWVPRTEARQGNWHGGMLLVCNWCKVLDATRQDSDETLADERYGLAQTSCGRRCRGLDLRRRARCHVAASDWPTPISFTKNSMRLSNATRTPRVLVG